ncbi:glycosyltransferase family 4 protein [Clostridium sp. AM58-1XD]|uniref:glycosyltransferase family 4 protein n=1 Tax=Clostridium sp. AM58-1XD TaxID=2292307 RepID=UPI0015F36600|nr:glycosyltransferase family 4 protein [Clostridium sp. AM58-1XD]
MEITKKALLVTTVSGFIPQFEMNNVRLLQKMGYEVHYASNYHTPSYGTDNHRLDGTGIIRHQIDFVRSPFKVKNITVYRQLRDLMRKEHFDLVHCHTPMGGVMARLAAHATHTAPVIYTAHGFHFFKGASLINWLCYYPMEWFLSRYTDQQICINQEDYERAKGSFHAANVDYVSGVGIDHKKIPARNELLIQKKKQNLGFPSDKLILLSSGELIKRKNHETVIRAISEIKKRHQDNPDVSVDMLYVICGHGKLNDYLKKLVQELHVEDIVTFLGYREDMMDIYQTADIFVFPSYQEGLPMSLLEAMANGLPVICSDIRGSRDLMGCPLSETGDLEICQGGIMVKKADHGEAYCEAIQYLFDNKTTLRKLGEANALRSRDFSIEVVSKMMERVYGRMGDKH